MPSRSRSLLLLIAIAALTLGSATPALAAETAASDFVIVRSDNVVEDDLYAVGVVVRIDGTVDGDLLAIAADEIVVSGTVTGSVLAVAPTVTVTGSIEGSLRAAARTMRVTGHVAGDVVHAVYSSSLGADSSVDGEVLAWAGSVSSLGSIGGDLSGSVGSLDLAGTIGRDVDVSLTRLEVVDKLVVAGDLGYRSANEAARLDRADVGGAVVKKSVLPPNIRVRALGFLVRFLVVIFLTVSAIAVASSWPERTTSAVTSVRSGSLRSWGVGALILLFPALLASATGIIAWVAPPEAGLPLLVVIVPIVLAMVGVLLVLTLVAGVPVVAWLGRRLAPKAELHRALVAGSAAMAFVWLLPFIGWLVPLVVLPLGLGAWVRSWRVADAG